MQLRTIIAVVAALIGGVLPAVAAMPIEPSYTTDPYWKAAYDPGGHWSKPSCGLLGEVLDANESIIVGFNAEAGMPADMWLGGRFSPTSGEGKTTPVTVRVDDKPGSWALTARGELNDATALLPEDKEGAAFWKALYKSRTLHLTINGSEFHVGMRNFQGATDRFRQCMKQHFKTQLGG